MISALSHASPAMQLQFSNKIGATITQAAKKALTHIANFFKSIGSSVYQAFTWTASFISTKTSSIFRKFFPKKQPPIIRFPIEKEFSNTALKVHGSLPKWLSGTLVRNGPVEATIDGKKNIHSFDGPAMLHAYSFENGNVLYSNKFLETDAYKKVKEGSFEYSGFAKDPCRSLFKRFFTYLFPSKQAPLRNANVNVAELANKFVALTEQPLPVEFDPGTLATIGVFNYQDQLPKKESWESAHPHYDSVKKETINYLIQFGRNSFYTLYRMKDGSSTREIIGKIPVNNPAYMHSFAVTENHIVFTEFPFVVKPLDLLLKGKAFIQNFNWKPEQGTKFIVVNRHDGKVVKEYKTTANFAFHHANAFEEDGKLMIDMVTYQDASIIQGLNNDSPKIAKGSFPSKLERFSLSLSSDAISSETLFDETHEFPRINDQYDGHAYQYVYATGFDPEGTEDSKALYKINASTKKVLKWSNPDCIPGEPVFVPTPDAKEEDEGVILSVVMDKKNNSSFLLALDAKTMEEVARAEAPHQIPRGLHGKFFNKP